MFESFKAKRAQKKAVAEQARRDAAQRAVEQQRQQHLTELRSLLAVAQGHSSPMSSLMLKDGEVGVAQISNVGLIEERHTPGHYSGGSQGVSIPIGSIGGRSVRYHVGATRGHYVQGTPINTAVDHGMLSITDQRIVYQGAKKNVECLYSKLLGIQHVPGGLVISVSNRQKTTTLNFGTALDNWVDTRLRLAMALFHHDVESTIADLQSQITAFEAAAPSSAS
jgi:hypothetical protein